MLPQSAQVIVTARYIRLRSCQPRRLQEKRLRRDGFGCDQRAIVMLCTARGGARHRLLRDYPRPIFRPKERRMSGGLLASILGGIVVMVIAAMYVVRQKKEK